MPEGNLVKAQNLHKRYGSHIAVADLSLELARGDVLGLLGPNGAGKSTTLRMLAGCLSPSSGSVTINDADMREQPREAKSALGYLPEHPPLYPELSVRDYLNYCAGLQGIARNQRKPAVDSACQDCGLTQVSNRIIRNLSKGYQQRVGIAQAILHRPPLIILDEPTVGLDPNQILEIRELIKRLAEKHSIILSSHILSEIQATCTQVCIINHGQLVFSSDMQSLTANKRGLTLKLGLRKPPGVAELTALPGIESVDTQSNELFLIHCQDGADPRDALVKLALNKGWGPYELQATHRSLEEIFVDLTSRDRASAGESREQAA